MSVSRWKRAKVLHPTSRDDLIRVVGQARENGTPVLVAGGEYPATNGKKDTVLRMRTLRGILQLDLEAGQVKVQAGITLRELLGHLETHSLTLPISGQMPDLTVCDALAVGTSISRFIKIKGALVRLVPEVCGSGSGAVGDSLLRAEVLCADGRVSEWDWDKHAEEMSGLLAGLGALGILLSATLKCIPLFRIREVSFECPLQDIIRHWHLHLQASDSLSVTWYPLLDRVLVCQAEPMRLCLAQGQPLWKAVLAWLLLQSSRAAWCASWCLLRLALLLPGRGGSRGSSRSSRKQLLCRLQRGHCGWQHRTMCLQAQLRTAHCFRAQTLQPVSTFCRGLRWVLPSDSFPQLLRQLLPFTTRHPHLCTSPLHISFLSHTANNSTQKGLLSPISQESSIMIWTDWFRLPLKGFSAEQAEYEALLQSLGGRKSWVSGPVFVSPFLLAQMYPGYRRWCKLRRQLDPTGLFRSAYVRGMLYANPPST